MAAMISFTCPECKTALKGPADMEGKKARCKRCSHVFVLKANSPTGASPAAPPARGKTSRPATPAAKTSPAKPATKPPAKPETEPMTYLFQEDTEELAAGAGGAKSTTASPHGSQNPYGITDLDLAPRCPFCALELESEDAIICLHCGYNNQTRTLPAVQRTYANTGGEIFMWLLPGIGCVLGILALIGFICYLWLQLDPKHYMTQPAQIWGSIISGGVIFFLARFAIKRLIFHPTPPEMEKK